MKSAKRILITTGITGGHFFPAMSFAESYLEKHPDFEIGVLLPRREAAFKFDKYSGHFKFNFIKIHPLPRRLSLDALLFPLRFFAGISETFLFVKKMAPAAVVSFGSYGSVPAVFSAWLLGIPIIVHEQNKIFGWANLVSSFFAKAVGVSFEGTLGRVERRKMRYVGYPLRREIAAKALRKRAQEKSHCFRILVLGGSQGAHAINRAIFDLFLALTSVEKSRFAVIHITGPSDFESVKHRYAEVQIAHEVYAFHNQMEELFQRCDWVVGRAGAGTIFEMAAFGLPGILIPYPYAYSHQSRNALAAEAAGGVVMIPEERLDSRALREVILRFSEDPQKYQQIASGIRKLCVLDADKKMVELVDEYLKIE